MNFPSEERRRERHGTGKELVPSSFMDQEGDMSKTPGGKKRRKEGVPTRREKKRGRERRYQAKEVF